MTEPNTSKASSAPEKFTVDEWVDFYEGEWRTVARVVEVEDVVVTVHIDGDQQRSMKFSPRASDYRYVRLVPNEPVRDHEVMPTMIFHGTVSQRLNSAIAKSKLENEKKSNKSKWTWRDVRDFLHGMFWGAN